jgi:23S rRNA (guanosine2251-2'-O)-methyltransferase
VKQNKIYIYGKHALLEALEYAPKAVLKIYTELKALDPTLKASITHTRIPVAPLSEGLARSDMKSGAGHQNIVAQISLFNLLRPYQTFIDELKVTPQTSLLLLAGIEDPHNVGALIRSSAGFGISGVLMPERGQAPVSGAVVKVSAGMAFRVPLITIENLEQTISDLKKRGFAVHGLAGESKKTITEESFEKPSVFILGNEGEGLPAHLRNLCDGLLRIPTHKRTESLNVAAAGAVALYAWSVKHPEALK